VRGVEKLTLPEVQARLQEMNGMLATAATDELEQNLVARWSKLDPIGASQFAADAVAQGGNPRLLQTAATAWAKTDPIGASQWAATLDSPLARDTALGQIFGTWSSTNPAQAASAIATLPMGSAQTVATSAVARHFAKGNLNATLQWAEGLSGPVQLAATREIVNLWSNSDPEATGAWIMQQGSQQVRSEALRQLAAPRNERHDLVGQRLSLEQQLDRNWLARPTAEHRMALQHELQRMAERARKWAVLLSWCVERLRGEKVGLGTKPVAR
jgi:hypothetical protein